MIIIAASRICAHIAACCCIGHYNTVYQLRYYPVSYSAAKGLELTTCTNTHAGIGVKVGGYCSLAKYWNIFALSKYLMCNHPQTLVGFVSCILYPHTVVVYECHIWYSPIEYQQPIKFCLQKKYHIGRPFYTLSEKHKQPQSSVLTIYSQFHAMCHYTCQMTDSSVSLPINVHVS